MRRVVVGSGEHEVLGHHDVERVAWPDLDRGGDTHATADQFRRDLAQLLPHGSAKDVAGGGPTAGNVLGAAVGQELGQVSSELIRRGMSIAPTIEIRPGYAFNVMVTQDLVFP